MTEFKRTAQAVEEIEGLVQSLLDGSGSSEVQRLGQLVGDTGPIVEKLSRKAAETDPTKQTYGSAMRDKVGALAEKWNSVSSLARDVLAQRGGSVATPSQSDVRPPPPPRPPSTGSVLWQPPQAASTLSPPATTTPIRVGASPASAEERRQCAARAAENRLGISSTGGSSLAGSSSAATGSSSAPAGSSGAAPTGGASSSVAASTKPAMQPLPVVARMDALLHLVHCVFVGHGFSRADDDTAFSDPSVPYRLRYTHESRSPICVTYVPVQRHLVAYASFEDAGSIPAKATVQVGMAAAAVQAKVDYLLLYPLLHCQCLPTLSTIPPETLFTFLCGLSLPALAKTGCTSRAMSAAIFDDDVLWYRVVLALPQSPQLAALLASAKQSQERGEALPKGAYRVMVRTEVQRARAEAEEMRRRREEAEAMQRRMRDPLMVQPPRRPRQPFPGPGFGIGGPDDLMPGGGFGPLGGGRRDPFGGRGGFGGGGFGGGLF